MNQSLTKNMAHLTYGIYILTTRVQSAVNGMIASWVSQVSYDPPLILTAVHPNRYTHDLLHQSGHFALHILAKEQRHLLARFKGSDAAKKFDGLEWTAGVTGCPLLADCIGCLECRVRQHLAPGNHTLFIGQVVNAVFRAQQTPMCTLDYEGCYTGER
ncbi:MAG: flavin reductase family protein [Desulfosarcina sp.]|jgi:flavin reductase (DIM6/NTAB) family NADH-FMN oxidoreductase RutF